MAYDCKQLTEVISQFKDKFGGFDDHVYNRKVADALATKKDLKSLMEPVLGFLDPEKYSKREELAKKHDLAFVGILSGGIFYGERKESDPLRGRFIIFNKDGGPNIYCDKLLDTNQGTYLIQIKDNWTIIDSTGTEISPILTDPEFIPEPPNFGKDSQPILLNLRGKRSYLCPDGKIILENTPSDDNFQFSQNRVWIKYGGAHTLYNNAGVGLKMEYFNSIYPYQNGIAVARTRSPKDRRYDFIDIFNLNGTSYDISTQVDHNAKITRTGDIIESELDGEPIYFDTKGKVFENAPKYTTLISSDPPLFKQNYANNLYKILDINGNPIVDEEFSNDVIVQFKEGLIFVLNMHRKFACYDTNGNAMFGGKEFLFASSFINGCAVVYDDGGGYLIDKKGKDLFSGKRYKSLGYDSPRNTYTCVESDLDPDEFRFVDKKGNLRFDEFAYNDLDPNE